MTDLVLRIASEVAAGVRGARAFKQEITDTRVATADLRDTYVASAREMAEQARKQVLEEKAKVDVLKQQIAVQREVTASYKRNSEERQLSTRREIELQRKLASSIGESALASAHAARSAGRSAEARDAEGFGRGFASRSGVAGAGLSAIAGPGFLAGALIGGGIDEAVKAAKEEQVAAANLQGALRNIGKTRDDVRERTERFIKTEEDLTGFDRGTVTQTLSQLIRSTGSLTKAREDEAAIANVARARNTDLAGSMTLILRASQGQIGSLRRLGIDVQKVTTYEDKLKDAHLTGNRALEARAKALDLAATKSEVMQTVTQKFAGASSDYMKTFAGRTAELHNEFHDLEVTIGDRAIPRLTNLFAWIIKEKDAVAASRTAHKAWADTLVVLKDIWNGARIVIGAAEELMRHRLIRTIALVAGAIYVLDAAVAANPWVALAAAALIAISEIQKHWSGILAFFERVWAAIVKGFKAMWDGIKYGGELAWYGLLKVVQTYVDTILHIAQKAVGWIPGVGGKINKALDLVNSYVASQKPSWDKTFANLGSSNASAWTKAFQEGIASGLTAAQSAAAIHHQGGAGTAGATGSGAYNTRGGNAAAAALTAIGTPYSWGGGGAGGASRGTGRGASTVGYDCSGLAQYALAQVGISIPRTSQEQYAKAPYHPAQNELEPGDLVFYEGSHPGHVAVYIGNGQVVHAPHTGETVQIASVNMMKVTGTARWWGAKSQTQKGTQRKPPPKVALATQPDASFMAAVDAASSAAGKAKTHGLTQASLTSLTGSLAAELRDLPKDLDPVERAAVAHIKQLRDSLHVGMSSAELAKDKVELAKWGKTLQDEIKQNADAAKKVARQHKKEVEAVAAAAAKAWQEQWGRDTAIIQRSISEQWEKVQQTYDRDTQATLTRMQRTFAAEMTKFDRETGAHITQMQRDFQAKMTAFDRETQSGLEQFVVAQTPEERALADFVAQRQAADAAKTDAQQQSELQDAYASGDPQRIAQALDAINQTTLDRQQASLQAQADASRAAADNLTTQQQQAYQDQRDALKQALQDDEDVRERDYQDRRDALKQSLQDDEDTLEQSYQDRRASQWQALNDMHSDAVTMFEADLESWNTWLTTKQKSWADFLRFLKANPVSKGFDGSAIVDPAATAPPTLGTTSGLGGATGYFMLNPAGGSAAGGIHMRPTVRMLGEQGPEATVPLTGPQGIRAIAQLARAIQAAGGGLGGGGTTVYGTFLGATERQVGRALEGLVTPQQSRVVRYRAPF